MLNGEPGAVPKVIGHWMLRSVLMMPGLALAGVRDKRLITGALLSSSFVSLFLIAYTAFERQRPGRRKRARSHALGSRPMYSKGPRQVRASGGVRFYAGKYGLTHDEAQRLLNHPNREQIVRATEQWREEHGYPAPNSPLARGYLLDRLRSGLGRSHRALGTRYRLHVRTRKLPGTTSICVEARNKADAVALVEGSSKGTRVVRIARGC